MFNSALGGQTNVLVIVIYIFILVYMHVIVFHCMYVSVFAVHVCLRAHAAVMRDSSTREICVNVE